MQKIYKPPTNLDVVFKCLLQRILSLLILGSSRITTGVEHFEQSNIIDIIWLLQG